MTTDKLIYLYCDECDILYLARIYPDSCPLCEATDELHHTMELLKDAELTIFEISNKGD